MRALFDYCLKMDVIATLSKSCGKEKCLWRQVSFFCQSSRKLSKQDNYMTVTHVFLNAFFDDRSQNRTSHDDAGECKTAKNRVLTPFYQVDGLLINARC